MTTPTADRYFITDNGERAGFRYTVWRGADYPYCSLVQVAMTRWGARRAIRKDRQWRSRTGGRDRVTIWDSAAEDAEKVDRILKYGMVAR